MLAYRRAAQRVRESGGSVAQLALEGKAKELQGIGKTIEEKIVQIVEQGEIEALAKRRKPIPPRRCRLHAAPRARARRPPADLAGARRDDARRAKTAAETEQLRTLTGLGAEGRGERPRGADRSRRSRRRPRARCSGRACRRCSRSSQSLRDHPASDQVSEAGSVRRRRETFRDLDIIATATDAQALIDAFTGSDWVAEVKAKGGDEGDGDLVRGLPLRPPGRAAGVLRQPAPALHRLEGAQRRDARGGRAAAASRSPSTASPRSRAARCTRSRDEQELYEFLGYQFIPPELRENAGELEAARARRAPRRWSRSGTSAATSTRTRPGRRTARARWRRWPRAAKARGYAYLAVTDHSHYLRDGSWRRSARSSTR